MTKKRHIKIIILRRWFKKQKIGKICSRCGEKDPRCLEFHHRGMKRRSVSSMVNKGFAKRLIRNEMRKCDIICGNCHRKEHYGVGVISLKKKSSIEKYILRMKNTGKCVLCVEKAPCCLEFDHIDETKKSFAIGEALRGRVDRALIEQEIEKCQLLCRNCHRKKHLKPFKSKSRSDFDGKKNL